MSAANRYAALLRGINVGGRNRIEMAALRECFEAAGFGEVSTYIQSGNVLFGSPRRSARELEPAIEEILADRFSYEATAIVLPLAKLRRIVAEAPAGFGSEPDRQLCDVIFLKPPLTGPRALAHIDPREGIDRAHAGRGVLYFSRLRERASGSRLSRITQTEIYPRLTIRNWNTTTKLLARLEEA